MISGRFYTQDRGTLNKTEGFEARAEKLERERKSERKQIRQRDLSLAHKNKWHHNSCQSADVTQRRAVRIHSSILFWQSAVTPQTNRLTAVPPRISQTARNLHRVQNRNHILPMTGGDGRSRHTSRTYYSSFENLPWVKWQLNLIQFQTH